MGLEASDMNDGTILKTTVQTKDGRGNIQFSIPLPSGRILKSEYVSPDNARTALKAWLDVVKEQAVADSNEERLQRAAAAKLAQREKELLTKDPAVADEHAPLFRAGGARVDDVVKRAEHLQDIPSYDGDARRAANVEVNRAASIEIVEADRPGDGEEESPEDYSGRMYSKYRMLSEDLYEKYTHANLLSHKWQKVVEALADS